MNNEFESRRRKSYMRLRMIYDFTMAGIILAMGLILFFGNRVGLDMISELDPVMRYGFAGLCLLYGSFRVYRGIKHDY
jgi:hypothetical protein